MRREYRSMLLNEGFSKVNHSSGLTIYMYPVMENIYTGAYLAVNYGSVNDCLLKNGKVRKFPEGTAHFIEHMLMERKTHNTSLFANTGAMANAYCTYDRTVYYFSCVDKFRDSLEILINAVLVPSFEDFSVDRERAVIIQEIKQNQLIEIADSKLFDCLYYSHVLKVPVAGTEQSVRKLDSSLLLEAYNAAYYPDNMVLVVTGCFDETVVLDVVDLAFKNMKSKLDTPKFVQSVNEPLDIKNELVVSKLYGISNPFFCIGFKETPEKFIKNLYNSIVDELIIELLTGEISPLYQELYDKEIISTPLVHESMCRHGYVFNKLSGESENPKNIMVKLKEAIKYAKETEFDLVYFERCRKALVGRFVSYFDNMFILANYIIMSHFSGTDIYSLFEYMVNLDQKEIRKRLLNAFHLERCAISIVEPLY
mgnify:CR=1 FL=1